MMSTKTSKTPKRFITRMRVGIAHNLLGAGASMATFGATRRLTLIRSLLQGVVFHTDLTADFAEYEMLLEIRPRAQNVAVPAALGAVSFDEVPKEEIWRHRGSLIDQTGAGTVNTELIFIDTKAMRKLRIDDTVNLSAIADSDTKLEFLGNLYLWLKEV